MVGYFGDLKRLINGHNNGEVLNLINRKSLLIVFQVVLGIIYFSAGMSKLIAGFPNIIGPVWLIDELAKYNLALFGYFIAIMQSIIGGLLLTNRFRLVALLMLLPMHMCILIIPISLGWQGTPAINAVLLCMIFALMFNDRTRLLTLIDIKPLTTNNKSKYVYIVTFIVTWIIAIVLKYGLG